MGTDLILIRVLYIEAILSAPPSVKEKKATNYHKLFI